MPYQGISEKVSENDKQRLLDCHLNGDDYVELARVLGIKRKTAHSIIARFKATGFVIRAVEETDVPKLQMKFAEHLWTL